MGIVDKLNGLVLLEVTSASFDETVREINLLEIPLIRMKRKDQLTGSFWIRRKDVKTCVEICEKREAKVRILEKRGGYWIWMAFLHRPVLVLMSIIIMLTALFLPSRILFVKVEGNVQIPERRILADAEECGIGFGALRRDVRSEKVKNALLASIPELQWVGVNTAGCVATICVRERNPDVQREEYKGAASMIAERDGYILSVSATKGNLMVKPGQTVTAGQLLISGYTDCGIVLRAEYAEGEIYAQTKRELLAAAPIPRPRYLSDSKTLKKISLVIGKKRIFLWKDSGISPVGCGRMYEEYYATLPGGFRLPICLCVDRFTDYAEGIPTEPGAVDCAFLKKNARNYLTHHMTAGEILQAQEKIMEESGCLVLKGTYVCREMIGRMRLAQIGEIHG